MKGKVLLFLNILFLILFSIKACAQENPSLIGEYYPANEIRIESQDYIDKYFDWQFTEINNTHWIANFTINQTLWQDVKNCKNTCEDNWLSLSCLNCWRNIKSNYFSEIDFANLTKLINDFREFLNQTYPLVNLTQNIEFSDFQLNLTEGKASFYIIFTEGFKENEKAKFGFDSTIIDSATTAPFYPYQRAICRDGQNYIHAVWLYNSTQLRYAKSINNGLTWSINTSFYGANSTATSTKGTPSISCDGNNITVAYEDITTDVIIIGISTDNGVNWNWTWTHTCVYNDVVVERRGQRIYVVYKSHPTSACGYSDIRFFNSSDGGKTWGNYTILWDGSYSATGSLVDYDYYYEPSMVVDGTGGTSDKIHVATKFKHYDNMEGTANYIYTIYYKKSTTSGSTWDSEVNLITRYGSPPEFEVVSPSINIYSSNVYVAYHTSTQMILFNSSSDSGSTWTGLRLDSIDSTSYRERYSSVAINNNTYPCVFWQQDNTTSDRDNIVYKSRNATTWWNVNNLTTNYLQNQYPNTRAYYKAYGVDILWVNGTGTVKNISYDLVNCTALPLVADTTPPAYSLNSTNSTLAGSAVSHNLKWTDNVGLSYAVFSFDNCTGALQNITGMSLSGTSAWSNFTVGINSTVGCTIRWCVYANDTSNNWNTSCENPFSYTTTSECSVAIGLSNALASGIIFGNIDPGQTKDASGNNGAGVTDYYITVSISGCNPNTVNVYMKASGDLASGSYNIPLSNEKFRNSTTDNTVPSSLQNISLTTNYVDNRIGSNLENGTYVYLKFLLSVPSNQRAGDYSNIVYIWGGRSDLSPP